MENINLGSIHAKFSHLARKKTFWETCCNIDRLVFPFQAQAAKFEKDPYSRSSLISLSNVGQQEKFQHFVQKSMFYEVIFIYLLSPILLQKFL